MKSGRRVSGLTYQYCGFRREIHARYHGGGCKGEEAQQAFVILGQRNEKREAEIKELFAAQAPRGTVEREEIIGFGDIGIG